MWVVRQRLAGNAARVSSVLSDTLADLSGEGTAGLTGLEGIATASLFLRSGDPAWLVWVLEPATDATFDDPDVELRRSSPLYTDDLEDLLADGDEVLPNERARLVGHETLRGRPTTVEERADTLPVVLSDGRGPASPADAVLLRLAIRPGLPGRFLAGLVGLIGRLRGGRIEHLFRALSEPVMEAEGMYTETLVLEDVADGRFLTWYMEFADLDTVYEAYDDTSNPVARVSEFLLGRVLVDPAAVLTPPRDPDFELLAHAVSPDRS